MAIHVALTHRTAYRYDQPVAHAPHVVRLRPAPHCRTRILSYSQRITGGEHFINWQQDPFSNWNARLVFLGKMREFAVEVELVAEMAVHDPFDFFVDEAAQKFPFAYEPALKKELAPFMELPPATPRLLALVDEVLAAHLKAGTRTIDFLVELNQRLQRQIQYTIRLEAGVQTPEETLEKSLGSCRDTGWLLAALLRSLGFAARFVSGYLIQLAADVKALDGPSGTDVDFTDLHAWCEVYLPGAGWIGLDPTSGLLAGEGHIPLSCTPEPANAAPITGATDPCRSELLHEMKVTRIHESPRVTKPYTDEQWAAIESLGHHVDADIAKHDIRLTMGGEPTFISIDDFDGAEWNTTALGPTKRALSDTLLRRIQPKFAPGALLHYGQGKQYPGEPLPRWAFGCYWRKDGHPIWQDHALIADEKADPGHTAEHSAKFITALATRIGVDTRWIMPASEDSFHEAWKARRLPVNTAPQEAAVPASDVVGHALPIQRHADKQHPGWISGPWFLPGDRLELFPGDSPMGLRLPLDSLPWVSAEDYPYIVELDPAAPRGPLPKREQFRQRTDRSEVPGVPLARSTTSGISKKDALKAALLADPTRVPKPGESAAWIIRTALCVEPRGGRLHVFMPPVALLEEYLELITAVEDTAALQKMPVVIEGYTPPFDPRLNVLKVTPDPGVIEVNLHPSKTWDQLVENTTFLYEEARQSRLGTEKFMLDGRHTGTGGGNHIILGGETPPDSPILRRPDLLRSLLAYWQNHPSLSFLFSSISIGPTSQSPRVDEARNDSLYELGIAFKELDRQSTLSAKKVGPALKESLPWIVDRLFRNLLIDASGNTHRAEFSIDKLFSPDGSSGRLGLLEMRAFEMPPHARMSLAQHLLLRGLVAKFWQQPYTSDLIPWGTDIHDRWLLPHFCEADFRDVIHDLHDAGYAFDFEWFAPHFEFRFPRIGEFAQRDVQVELRSALEPWHVLGEEGGAGGTVRYVDSSLERLQIKAGGLTGERFALTVNGRRIPLHRTGVNGEAVAGVRYRAWKPPNCLQPTIAPHAPLIFDLYDTWNGRSLGGCQYHVSHPGGRSYDTFPVNSYEAEARRLARFFTHGATQGKFTPPPITPNACFPFTLDLRNV
jgi:uncharacterized protein (DUF2126 family)